MEILLGAGSSRIKKLWIGDRSEWGGLQTLDFNDDHKPDHVHDLNNFPYPFMTDSAGEIHAYEVVEHLWQQGDFRSFFRFWSEIWRILKNGGHFFGTSPDRESPWAWGDPGHTNIVSRECLTFLSQPEYIRQVGVTPMSDYRFCYKADFDIAHAKTSNGSFQYVLKAIKPSRIHG